MFDPAIINLPDYTYNEEGRREINRWWSNLQAEVRNWKRRNNMPLPTDLRPGRADPSQTYVPPAHLIVGEPRAVVVCKWVA